MASTSDLKFRVRLSKDRGHADHDWLKTYHTFSFASYFAPEFSDFGPLRVINEDRVSPSNGFGKHSHREFEIYSYIVGGQLDHKDSLGGQESMKRGDLQMTSVGTGVAHSEYNGSDKEPVHFLQIWAKPNKSGLSPQYYHRHFSDADKTDKFCKITAPLDDPDVVDSREGSGPAPIHSDLTTYASIVTPGKSVEHAFSSKTRRAYVHYITSSYKTPRDNPAPSSLEIKVGVQSVSLAEGDGLFIEGGLAGTELVIANAGTDRAELLLWAIYV